MIYNGVKKKHVKISEQTAKTKGKDMNRRDI